jgi:hypothetical protein
MKRPGYPPGLLFAAPIEARMPGTDEPSLMWGTKQRSSSFSHHDAL